ncbi:methylornithine synthase [Methanohalophilus levihalophilus]|uniref:methylornithine synthase PylB n=1 Tax=Methanohalophilus levihalophilus TaxID=1431282 RepID=UPI001AEB1A95|nr:methylornithine synthase PylB [Methanohalophilus levihalophilus]MBP2030156.1 methylornithine synthase [Methanohalophilus levihalophilus]
MLKDMSREELDNFAESIINGQKLSDDNLRNLLNIEDDENLEKLYSVARAIRDHNFGNKVFLYSFVYFSTYCKNNCAFCYYNCKNDIDRYRLTPDEIEKVCEALKDDPIHMVDLTMGEDPYYHNHPERLVEAVRRVKEIVGLPIMVSPGVVENDVLEELRENGADFLALYQETYDPELYAKLRVGQSYKKRIDCRNHARKTGMCIEDGILTEVEPDNESTFKSLRGLENTNPDMVRVMTFVPQEGTPLEEKVPGSSKSELKIIAILRLMFPDRLIPASLDLEGIDGMVHRLNAGANVVTSIIPSGSSLEGVVNYDRDLAERDRDAHSVVKRLESMGMEPAKQEDFNMILMSR